MSPHWTPPPTYQKNLGNDPVRARELAEQYVEEHTPSDKSLQVITEWDFDFDLNAYGAGLSSRERFNLNQIEKGVWPFGKHEGDQIANAPRHYVLWWANRNVDSIPSPSGKALIARCHEISKEQGWLEIQSYIDKGYAILRVLQKSISKYVGEVGKRARFIGEQVFVKSFETQFGVSFIRKFIDPSGNILVYFGGSCELGYEGDIIHFDAKVKEHSEYDGSKQTIVQRPTKIKMVHTVKGLNDQ